MYIYYIYDRACIMDASWAMEPQLPLPDELLRLLVDVVSFRTREAVGGGPGDKVVDLDLGHLLHRHLPGSTSTGAGRRRRRVLAPTNHLLLLLDQMLLRLPDRSARWD